MNERAELATALFIEYGSRITTGGVNKSKFLIKYLAIVICICYIIRRKGTTAHKVVDLPDMLKAYLYRTSNKVGLFIFAYYSYLYR